MKLNINIHLVIISLALLSSCSSGGDSPEMPQQTPPPEVPDPTATTLIFPEDNTECNEGDIVSDTQSRVTFRWSATENTDSYEINLRNLNNNSTSVSSSLTIEAPITILRGVPYEWSVTSRAQGTTATATSATARFFNEGPGIENYAPFPADAIFPTPGSTVTPNNVQLEWSSGDIDGDLVNFEILLDTVDPPVNVIGETDTMTFEANISASQIYFWQVISRDVHGNTSSSQVFQFRTP